MKRLTVFFCILMIAFPAIGFCEGQNLDEILTHIHRTVSGNRARDYAMRLWQYDKWSTLPMWNKTAKEAQTIMRERGFDEAVIVDTPADGVTRHGTWTNPIGWDCTQATLEVIEPPNLPDEYRFLCNYRDNPTSLNNYSCPTPPEGIVSELVMVDDPTDENLRKAGKRGTIILVDSGSRGLKKKLDENGLLGIVSNEFEGQSEDLITANRWLNGWSDMHGGWQMNASDSRNNFGFSISQKKGAYLRNLIRQGKTVKVRAKIDSRYYTDGSLQYVVGSIKGSGDEGEDVVIFSHIYEWGANDDCTGASASMEALGAINELIDEGVLPRPQRTIRMWLGFEKYGSMAYTVHNLDRMRNKTIATVCSDVPAHDWDLATTAILVSKNFNASPSFTDALFPDVIGRFHDRYAPHKMWKQTGFLGGLDNFFGDPMIGVPFNALFTDTVNIRHHNSTDTIDKVDPRTLKVISTINATYLYYLANASEDDIPYLADITLEHCMGVLLDKVASLKNDLRTTTDSHGLGKMNVEGQRIIEYYTGLQVAALKRIERLVPQGERDRARKQLAPHYKNINEYGKLLTGQFADAVKAQAQRAGVKVFRYRMKTGDWEREAATIIPRRTQVGTLTLEGIPYEEW
ncbi:hypothetical protein ACFL47_11075, partial [Candidatus Latescibacterota bacterium]